MLGHQITEVIRRGCEQIFEVECAVQLLVGIFIDSVWWFIAESSGEKEPVDEAIERIPTAHDVINDADALVNVLQALLIPAVIAIYPINARDRLVWQIAGFADSHVVVPTVHYPWVVVTKLDLREQPAPVEPGRMLIL